MYGCGREKRTNSVSGGLCNSATVWIQFQSIGGISQREGYDKEHRRSLKLTKVPRPTPAHWNLQCSTASQPQPVHHPSITLLLTVTLKNTSENNTWGPLTVSEVNAGAAAAAAACMFRSCAEEGTA